jgi:hypothetical protein
MPIPLKIFSEDDPEPGRLWIGLPVVSSEPTEPPFEDVLVQPNIPNRGQRTAEAFRRAAQKRAEPQPEQGADEQP